MLTRARRAFGWSRDSSVLLALFLFTVGLIIYVWWPLVTEYLAQADGRLPWYRYVDWLLLGVFAFMTLTIMARADLRRDSLIVIVALVGGLVIEAWGTQTNLWFYYTAERPPLWIIPAWPIATLSIDRITRMLGFLTTKYAIAHPGNIFWKLGYWLTLGGFYLLMLSFVAPTLDKSFTIGALILTGLIILTPPDYRLALLVFAAGSGLGYFLERWGTTRDCWTYYTFQTPPSFAVLAHGMAAVAFWRAGLVIQWMYDRARHQLAHGIRSHLTRVR
jgi:hypothetical protein